MKWFVTLIVVLLPTLALALDISVTAATGIVNEHSNLVEVSASTEGPFTLSASYGKFGNTQYADAGIAATYKRVTFGLSGAYLYTITDKLSGHMQFKIVASYRFTESLSLKGVHFSNGGGIFGHGRFPNRGVNFLGLEVGI